VQASFKQSLERKWYQHTNPVDIISHLLSKSFDRLLNTQAHGVNQARYYGGLHWGGEEIGGISGWYHRDLYDVTLLFPLGVINHNLWEVFFEGYKPYMDGLNYSNKAHAY